MIDTKSLKGKPQEIFDDGLMESIINEAEDLIVNEGLHNSSSQCVDYENANEFTKNTDSWFDDVMQTKQLINLDKECKTIFDKYNEDKLNEMNMKAMKTHCSMTLINYVISCCCSIACMICTRAKN